MALERHPILHSIYGRVFGLNRMKGLVLNRLDGFSELLGASMSKQVTSAQLLALNATAIQVVPAPTVTGDALVFRKAVIYKPAGTAYAGIAAGEDLVFKYTNAAGAQVSSVIETTGFLDQATAQTRYVGMPGSVTTTAADVNPVANAAIMLHLLTGEITTGTSPLNVRVWYDVIETAFTGAA